MNRCSRHQVSTVLLTFVRFDAHFHVRFNVQTHVPLQVQRLKLGSSRVLVFATLTKLCHCVAFYAKRSVANSQNWAAVKFILLRLWPSHAIALRFMHSNWLKRVANNVMRCVLCTAIVCTSSSSGG
jgi:hypothetical protein